MFDFSPIQIIIVLVIALVVLGPKRLPSMAKSLGHGLRGFRDSLAGNDEPEDGVDAKALAVATKDEVDEQEALMHLQPVEPAETPADEEGLTRLQAVEPVHSAR